MAGETIGPHVQRVWRHGRGCEICSFGGMTYLIPTLESTVLEDSRHMRKHVTLPAVLESSGLCVSLMGIRRSHTDRRYLFPCGRVERHTMTAS